MKHCKQCSTAMPNVHGATKYCRKCVNKRKAEKAAKCYAEMTSHRVTTKCSECGKPTGKPNKLTCSILCNRIRAARISHITKKAKAKEIAAAKLESSKEALTGKKPAVDPKWLHRYYEGD